MQNIRNPRGKFLKKKNRNVKETCFRRFGGCFIPHFGSYYFSFRRFLGALLHILAPVLFCKLIQIVPIFYDYCSKLRYFA